MITIEDFRHILINDNIDLISSQAYLDILTELDPKGVFSGPWTACKPILEVYPKFTPKIAAGILKKGKKILDQMIELSFECPKGSNDFEWMFGVVARYCSQVFKVSNAVLFENPETSDQFPSSLLKHLREYSEDSRDFEDIMEKVCLPPDELIRSLDKVDRFSRRLDTKRIEEFLEGPGSQFVIDLQKSGISRRILEHPELTLVGWFKELRDKKLGDAWFEEYLKEISLPAFTSEDLRMVLLCAKIKDEEALSFFDHDEIIDLFWDNTDKVYEALFHENIYNTPTYIARIYVSQYQLGEQKERH